MQHKSTRSATVVSILSLAVILGLRVPVFAAPSDSMLAGSTRLTDGTTMVFRLYVPRSYANTKKYPLVVTLHGVGEKGSDNRIQVDREEIVRQWMMDSVQKKYAPFILSPQCPSNSSWASGDGSAGGPDIGVVKVIDSLRKVYSLDSERLYVAGLSMGGAGTWGMVKSYPKKFAATIPCAGAMGFNPSFTVSMIDGANTAKTAYWAFHGTADPTVDVMYSRRIDTAVRNAGIPVVHYTSSRRMANPTGISNDSLKKTVISGALHLYSEITNGNHADGWMEAWYHPFVVPWLFSKSKVNGQTVFTWPAPGVGEVTGVSRLPANSRSKISLSFARGIVRWNGCERVPARMRIWTMDGTLVAQHTVRTQDGTLDCSGLASGIYSMEVGAGTWSEGRIITAY